MSQSLLELLKQSFDEGELEDLAYELRIELDDVVSRLLGRAERMRALVQYCQRNGRLPDLITLCQQLRPQQEWPDPALLGSDAELLGEPVKRLHFEPETVPVPAGAFSMGSDAADAPPEETPHHVVELAYFRMGKYPITNAQYAEFLKQNPAQNPPPPSTGWFGKTPPQDKPDHPVVGVSWEDAVAYCQWLSEATGRSYRLPTEAAWEKAARGTDERPYPWGHEWIDGACNADSAGTTAVTAHDDHLSPYGCADMLGNVAEWTSTLWGDSRREPQYPYPYQANDGREDPTAHQQNPRLRRICRGGAYDTSKADLRCTARTSLRVNGRTDSIGFRIALTA
ncbi:MAG: SUMF1/EgtB/PvdO family nonheme iron enzyme [Ardenticatenaceae bacterium]|nr:SUMF1/EgtB/PvdO family nonheme iron enzyme [Anaerolineales bacterium]MCB8920139.1 SUMF1/EgtB/PvdO family nonheme iron enzyme [Ardenticatenaceae bacterium]MCB8992201.1 SUMF1/EgtB/PvdO family nonheme iron enzyme [Ardenticatenaceae bacterium]MCB9005068.1 SUMF1/EgtB/PvdO family nonheme iron enzyme [Ardenticatenaceae bacterium]